MTRERAKELWPVIKAYGEGRDFQYRGLGTNEEWTSTEDDFMGESCDRLEYRIKPEPKMRPMTRGEVLYVLSAPHCLIRHTNRKDSPFIMGIPDERDDVNDPITTKWLLDNYTSYEYAIIDESGEPVDGWHKFEKEIES